MSKKYYPVPDYNNPDLLDAVLSKTVDYIASLLYPSEHSSDPVQVIKDRFILSDIDSGNDVVIGDSIKFLKTSQAKFPFTAYNIGDYEEQEPFFNTGLQVGNIYCPEVGNYVKAWPINIEIPMISFFTRASDYRKARNTLSKDRVNSVKIIVPIEITTATATISKNLTVMTRFEISKGSYAFAFEEYLRVNKIYDIVHTIRLQYFDMYIEGGTIYPVDTMLLGFGRLDSTGNPIPESLSASGSYPQ